jgi:hypothetical protein
MTLYLGPAITPDEIRKAAVAGISGESESTRVPAGVLGCFVV